MPSPPPKRRRPNNNPILTKPFRSPLKQTTAAKNSSPSRQDATSPSNTPPSAAQFSELSALSRRARELRAEIDTLEQASRLLTPKKYSTSATPILEDEHLGRLTREWRQVAQTAADEVFEVTKERVNEMGGVAAWRKRERERTGVGEEWNGMESEAAKKGEDDGEEGLEGFSGMEKEEMKAMRREARDAKKTGRSQAEEDSGGGGLKRESETAGKDDEEEGEFTMGTMLKMMGIEFGVVGWEEEAGRWAE